MTREEAKNIIELLPLVKAYAEGAVIQVRPNDYYVWCDINEPGFNVSCIEYRIKPVETYIRFKLIKPYPGSPNYTIIDVLSTNIV